MNEQPLDLSAALNAIRRARVLVIAIALLAAALGGAYALQLRPLATARALVLLPSADITGTGTVSPYTSTQIIIAGSRPVLVEAASSLVPPVSTTTLNGEVSVSALSQNVLEVDARAPTARAAEAAANAVATSYISYTESLGSAAQGLVKQLKAQSARLTKDFLATQTQINQLEGRMVAVRPSTALGQRDASLLAGLQADQQQLSSQLSNINSQIVNTEVAGAQSSGGTTLLQQAQATPQSRSALVEYPVLGGLVGLMIASALAVVRVRRDKRLRARDAVAGAIGVPVVASVHAEPVSRASEWRRLMERHRTDPLETWNFRRVLHRLVMMDATGRDGGPLSLTAVVLNGDKAALVAAVGLAQSAVQLGVRVVLDVPERPGTAELRAGILAWLRSHGAGGDSMVLEPVEGGEFRGTSLRLVLVMVERGHPDVPADQNATLLILSAGVATADSLASVALAANSARSALGGILIVNAGPEDSTTGSLSQPADVRPLAQHRGGAPVSLADFSSGSRH